MKYSFIVAMHNAEKYIEECLKSMLNQSYDNYEIIIIDDGSTDKSSDIVHKYLDNRKIKYIYQNNEGCGGARNTAINCAKGEYIVIVDADDLVNKDLLLNLDKYGNDSDIIKYGVNCIEKNPNNRFDLVCFDSYTPIKAMLEFSKTKHIWATPWGYAIKKDIYLNNNLLFESSRYHEDFGLIPRLYFKAKSVTSIDYIGYNYIKRPNSMTTTFNEEVELKRAKDFIYHYINNIKLITFEEKLPLEYVNELHQYFSYRLSEKILKSSPLTQQVLGANEKKGELNYELHTNDRGKTKKL